MASRLVHPFLQSSQTYKQITKRATRLALGRIYAMWPARTRQSVEMSAGCRRQNTAVQHTVMMTMSWSALGAARALTADCR